MEARNNGTRFSEYRQWERVKNLPYDYAKDGLLNHIMSPAIVNTSNPMLKLVLNYIETSFVFVMKYIDVLKNFKNPHWRNR